MRGRVVKAFVSLMVLSLLCISIVPVFSGEAAEASSAETSTVISGGKVPVNYMEPEAYSPSRLAEGKAMFDAKCAVCHTDSGRDMVYFGDPDFNAARVAGSVKKFVGAATDPEIGEKVYEYLRYNNDGPFQSQNDPFLQPGPKSLEPGIKNPILSNDTDFWGSVTGHKIPTPDDVNIEKIYAIDMSKVIVPYPVANWAEFMPHEVPLAAAVRELRGLFAMQRYNLNNLPLTGKGLGGYFNYLANSVYTRYQFSKHDYFKADHSKDALEAVYSTSLQTWLNILEFEYGLPQRVNGEWNGPFEWGQAEELILWGPGSNLDNLYTYGINPFERISSRELFRNKWTQYSAMFVTGDFKPSAYFWYASMPWGCKTFDAGTFGGPDVQTFTGFKGFAEMWNHTKAYPGVSYAGTQSIANYGETTRKYLIDMYWQYEGIPAYANSPNNKQAIVNVFLEMIYRQWTAGINVTDDQLRELISDSYNLPDGQRDQQRYTTLVQSYESLQSVLTENQKDFVKAYIRRLYPTNPTGYTESFNPYKWDLVDPAPTKPIILPFGSDTAVAGEAYDLRILRAQASPGDIEITATGLPTGAELVKTKGTWQTNDFEYAIKWTPTQNQAGNSYTVTLSATSDLGKNQITTVIKVVSKAAPLVLDDIADYSIYEGQELTFPVTVQNDKAENLTFSMTGSFGSVMNNAWDTAGIYTVHPVKTDVGTHTVNFTVKAADGSTSQKSATITVFANSVPVVQMTPAGSGPGSNKNIYRVKAGETLRLTFNVTDADGDTCEISKNAEFPGVIYGNTYSYTVDEEMAQNFPGPNVLTFTIKDLAPNTSGNPYAYPDYKGGVVKKVLLVYFETSDSDPNHTPWAVTGPNQTVNSGATVTLDGSPSDDTDKDAITYKWTQVSGPKVALSSATSVKPTFIAPKVTTPTILKFYLTVTDPGGLSDIGVVRVTVNYVAAVPTASKVVVNGAPVTFDAYTINQENYFKLRDLAKIFSGSTKQFDVQWDDAKKAINLITNQPYTVVGGEMTPGDGKEKSAVLNTAKIYVDGKEVALTAYTINGSNYFKLRDIAKQFNIYISWENSSVIIDTSKNYS